MFAEVCLEIEPTENNNPVHKIKPKIAFFFFIFNKLIKFFPVPKALQGSAPFFYMVSELHASTVAGMFSVCTMQKVFTFASSFVPYSLQMTNFKNITGYNSVS